MSKYTTELRYICEVAANMPFSGFDKIEEVITAAAPKVFNFPWPIFDENYRLVLEKNILRHFYTREICEETVGLWKLRLSARLNDIMHYYNQLYESELLEFNPLYDVDVTRDHHRDIEGSEVTAETSESTDSTLGTTSSTQDAAQETATEALHWNKYSDTPQGAVTGIDSDTYLTNATKDTADDTTTTESSVDSATQAQEDRTSEAARDISKDITNAEDYIEHVRGKQGGQSYAAMLKEFRETFLDIDSMIIKDLEPLFFGLW